MIKNAFVPEVERLTGDRTAGRRVVAPVAALVGSPGRHFRRDGEGGETPELYEFGLARELKSSDEVPSSGLEARSRHEGASDN